MLLIYIDYVLFYLCSLVLHFRNFRLFPYDVSISLIQKYGDFAKSMAAKLTNTSSKKLAKSQQKIKKFFVRTDDTALLHFLEVEKILFTATFSPRW